MSSTTITINVRNNSGSLKNFFFFQAPAVYKGGQAVYTNSLYTSPLSDNKSTGAVLTFSLVLQFFAGAEQQVAPPVVGKPSGRLSAIQAIGLTPAAGGKSVNNTTNMSVDPSLGLSVPTPTDGPQAGSFRIITPPFNPVLKKFNIGSAMTDLSGAITLSNFVIAEPNTNLDCQPVLKFYVATGEYRPGTVMNFTSSSVTAALCDATPGFTSFDVDYKADGTWSVTEGTALLVAGTAAPRLAAPSATVINAEILNEAGTGIVATGFAANFNAPVHVTQLSNLNVQRFGEYQVGPMGGPYVGRMCTYVDYLSDTANFE